MLDEKRKRALLVRKKAREFCNSIKGTNMAFRLGDDLIDWLRDEEFPIFEQHCREFRVVKRKDTLWEEIQCS